MKKVLTIIVVTILYSVSCLAQKEVTRFLGIPVDGSKSEMIHKLKDKGFRVSEFDNEVLEGEFNGRDVRVFIVTNKDKVYRIMVCDIKGEDERSIQIRFNNLCHQFENNPKYVSLESNYNIPDDEDISYEMAVNRKRYSAEFCQTVSEIDTTMVLKDLMPLMLSKFTIEQLSTPTEETQTEMQRMMVEYYKELCLKKRVWFMIAKYGVEYYIAMYYDNGYNMANGEDL